MKYVILGLNSAERDTSGTPFESIQIIADNPADSKSRFRFLYHFHEFLTKSRRKAAQFRLFLYQILF